MSSEWSATKLQDLVSIKHGFAFKGEHFVDEVTPFQLTTPGNFAIGGGFQYGKGKYYSGPVPSDYVLRAGDLIVTMTDLSKAADTLGYAAIVPNSHGTTWLHNQRVGLVRPQDNINVHMGFIHYLMCSPGYRHWVVSTATGSTVKHTSPGRILSYDFLLPSLAEQREIGETLAVLDDRITLLRETNATLEAIAQALFKCWFVEFDPVRAKGEGRQPEGMEATTAALFPDSFEESGLGLVPKGWLTRPIYDMATYINGAAYKAFEPNAERRGLPIIKIAELKAGISTQTAFSDVAMPDKYLIETGDILFSWSGNPDTSIDTFVWQHAPALLNQHIFRVLPHESFERSFVLQMLRNLKPVFAELARNKQTTGLGHVTVADLKRLHVVHPPLSVIEQFNTVAVPIHQMIFGNEQQAKTLTQLRDTLLPRLISGQLRVPDAERTVEEALA